MRTRDSKTVIRTERECPECEDAHFIQDDYELFCEQCYYCPTRVAMRDRRTAWNYFWDDRQQYTGDHGPDRKKCIGGFIHPYVVDPDSLY